MLSSGFSASRAVSRAAWLSVCLWAGTMGCAQSHDVLLDGGESGEGGAGSGGSGGTAGAAGTGGTGGAPMCVVDECEAAPGGLPIPIEVCCTDEEECGLSVSLLGDECLPRDAPGVPDSDCPSQSMGPITFPGCCNADGVCGVQDSFIGLGCIVFGGGEQTCGDGGNGGSGGQGGSGGAGGQGGGGNECTNCPALGPFASFAGVTPCCTSSGQCGGQIQGVCNPLNQPGSPSEDCPPVNVMGFPLDGCCREDGTCGVDDGGAIGFGCSMFPGVAGGSCSVGTPD